MKIIIFLVLILSVICNNNSFFILGSSVGSSSSSSSSSSSGNSIINNNNNNSNNNEIITDTYPTNITRSYEGVWSITNGSISKLNGFQKKSGVIVYTMKNFKPIFTNNNNNNNNINNNNNTNDSDSNSNTKVIPTFDILEGMIRIRDGNYRSDPGVDGFVYGIYEYSSGLTSMLVLPYDDNEVIYKRPTSPINYTMVENMSTPEQQIQFIKFQIDTIVKNNNPFLFLDGNNGTMSIINNQTNKNNEQQQQNQQQQIEEGVLNDIEFNSNSFTMLKFTQQFQKISIKLNNHIIKELEQNDPYNSNISYNEEESQYFITNGTLESSFLDIKISVSGSGFNLPQFRSKMMNYVVMISLCSFVQIFVIIRQMDYTGTQTSASRVSIYTIGIQTILDAYLCLIHLSAGVIMDYLFNAFATASFFQFVTFALFEMRYLLVIIKARSPAAFADGWESLRREISLFYLRFYSCLFGGFILLYYFSNFFHFILFLMYSYWVPQIYVNAKSSVRKPFLWKYVIGISITRLTIPLYFYGCPKNIFVQPDPFFSNILIFWTVFQVLVLYLQSKLGPQFFIPARFLPQKYNFYRPISMEIRSREEGQGCVICMCDVEEGSKYMLTECNHLFHEKCLLQWLEFKSQCPTCRTEVVNYIE